MRAARAIRHLLAAAAVACAVPVAAQAGPPTALKLHVGSSAAGPEDYQFTAGDRVFAEPLNYGGQSYRITAVEPNGATTHPVVPCTTSASAPGGSYLVDAADPLSGSASWTMRLEQFASAGCTGTLTTVNAGFDVARATAYDSSATTTTRTLFGRNGAPFVNVAGLDQSTPDWTVRWSYGPSDTLVCANLVGHGGQNASDLPDSSAGGGLPSAAPAYLQYPPSSVGSAWNLDASYDTFGVGTACPAFNGSNDGQWYVTLTATSPPRSVRLPVFSVDATRPVVGVTSPANGSFRSPGTATLTGTAGTVAGDAANVTVTLYDDIAGTVVDGPLAVPAGSGTWSVGTPSLGNGQYRVDVSQTDAAGNMGTASSIFVVDGTAPHPSITIPSAGAVLGTGTPTFQGTAGTTAGASPDNQQMTLNIYKNAVLYDTRQFNRSGGGWQTTPNVALTDGSYTAEVVQSDAAGNTGTSAPVAFSVDTVPPVVTLGQPVDGVLIDDTTPSFSGSAGNLAGDGPVRLKIWNGANTGGGPARSYTLSAGSPSWSFTLPDPDALADGDYTVRAEQADSAGNIGVSDYHHFTLDATAPSSNVTSVPAAAGSGAFTVAYSAADAGPAGLQRVELWAKTPATGGAFVKVDQDVGGAIDNAFQFTPAAGEGTYFFYTVAVDNAGHVEAAPLGASGDALTDVDTTKPASTVTALGATTRFSSFTIGYTAADPAGGAGLDRVELWVKRASGAFVLALTDNTPASPTFDYTAPADDPYCFYTVAIDRAGNREAAPAAASGDTCTTVDTTAPTSSAAALPAYSATATLAVPYSATDGGTGLHHVDLWVKRGDGSFALAQTDTTPATPSFSYGAPADDSYCFYTVAVDVAGNAEEAPAAAGGDTCTTVDTAAPSPTITIPADPGNDAMPQLAGTAGIAPADAPTVTVRLWPGSTAGLPAAAARVFTGVTVDGSGHWQLPESAYTSGLTAALGDGAWTARAYQSDGASNTGSSGALTFTVDTGVPSSAVDPLADTSTSPSFAVTYGAADNSGGAGLDHVDLYVKQGAGAFVKQDTDSTPDATHSFGFAAPTDATYCFYTVAVDKAGNAEAAPGPTGDDCVQVDTGKPVSAADALPQFSASAALAIAYSAADEAGGSGLDHVDLYVKQGSGAYAKQGTDSTPDATRSFAFAAPADGEYCLYTVAVDRAGNAETAPASAGGDTCTTVDTAKPASAATALPQFSGGTPIDVAYTASDSGPAGLGRVELWVKRDSGSFALALTDTTPDSSQSFSYSAPGDGSYCFYTVAFDRSGNAETPPAGAGGDTCTTLDTVAATSGADALPADSKTAALSLAYHASDNGGGTGLKRVELWAKRGAGGFAQVATDSTPGATGTFAYSAPADDTYCFYTIAVDKSLNAEAAPGSPDTCTRVDTTPPAPASDPPASPVSDARPPLQGTAGSQAADASHSADAGTVTVRMWRNASAGSDASADRVFTGVPVSAGHWQLTDSAYGSGPTAPLDDHAWTARVSQDDGAGNRGASAPQTFTVDTANPAVALTLDPGAPNGTNGFYKSVTLHLDVTDTDVDTISCEVDHGSAVPVTPTGQTTSTTVAFGGDGDHDVTCTAHDHAGNSAADHEAFKVDGSAPAVTLTRPGDGLDTRDVTPALGGGAGTATNDGTVQVKIYPGRAATGAALHTVAATRDGGSWSADAPALADGVYTAVAEQSDQAGNVGRSTLHRFRVDTHAPAIASANEGRSYAQGSTVAAAFSCDDGGSGVASCTTSTANLDTAAPGAHSYHVAARDRAGNELGATVSYTVSAQQVEGERGDRQAPRVSAAGTPRTQALRRGALAVQAACDEDCTVRAGGSIALSGSARVHRLKTVARGGKAGARVKLALKLDRASLKAVRRALAKRRRVVARVTVTATDAAGNRRTVTVRVRIRRA